MRREGLAKVGLWGWGKEEIGESGNQGIGESGIRKSGNRGIGESGSREAGNQGIRKSGNRESGAADARFAIAGADKGMWGRIAKIKRELEVSLAGEGFDQSQRGPNPVFGTDLAA